MMAHFDWNILYANFLYIFVYDKHSGLWSMVFLPVLMLPLNVGMRTVCAGLFYHLFEYALVKAYSVYWMELRYLKNWLYATFTMFSWLEEN